MHQISRPTPQSLPKHIIPQPPNPKLPHRLPKPSLKHIGRPLLLRNNTNRRSAALPQFPRLSHIRRPEST